MNDKELVRFMEIVWPRIMGASMLMLFPVVYYLIKRGKEAPPRKPPVFIQKVSEALSEFRAQYLPAPTPEQAAEREKQLKIDIRPRVMAALVALEMACIMGYGTVTNALDRARYEKPGSGYTVFSANTYSPADPDSAPSSYSFVAVRYDESGAVASEDYHSITGDRWSSKYIHGKWKSTSGMYISNMIFIFFPITGFVMIALTGVMAPLAPPIKTPGQEEDLLAKMKIWGYSLFFSAFVGAPVKWLLFGM